MFLPLNNDKKAWEERCLEYRVDEHSKLNPRLEKGWDFSANCFFYYCESCGSEIYDGFYSLNETLSDYELTQLYKSEKNPQFGAARLRVRQQATQESMNRILRISEEFEQNCVCPLCNAKLRYDRGYYKKELNSDLFYLGIDPMEEVLAVFFEQMEMERKRTDHLESVKLAESRNKEYDLLHNCDENLDSKRVLSSHESLVKYLQQVLRIETNVYGNDKL